MGGINTGELYTQDQVDRMTESEKRDFGVVPITPAESSKLQTMTKEERKKWFKKNKSKKPTRKQLNKRERQNKKAGRNGK